MPRQVLGIKKTKTNLRVKKIKQKRTKSKQKTKTAESFNGERQKFIQIICRQI